MGLPETGQLSFYWERGGEREASDPAILPGMWKHLSEKLDRPFVGETGIYIGNIEKNASPLMALALVLINRNLLKERLKLSQTDIYRVLCKHFEVPFASAPHRARDTNTYDDVLRQADKYFERSK